MRFEHPVFDIEKHIEMRKARSIQPTMFGSFLEKSFGDEQFYRKALEEFNKQVETLNKIYSLTAEATVYSNRIEVWNWLEKSLSEFRKAVENRDWSGIESLINQMESEIKKVKEMDVAKINEVSQKAKTSGISVSIPTSSTYTSTSSTSSSTSKSVVLGPVNMPVTKEDRFVVNYATGEVYDTKTKQGYTVRPDLIDSFINQIKASETKVTQQSPTYLYPGKESVYYVRKELLGK